jgi:tetrahydromethanopterin S-methyltransferase subunit B
VDSLSGNKGAELFTALITSLMNSKNVDVAAKDYVQTRLAPYIIFIIFAAFSLIGIFFYCTCCMCPCRCCKKTEEGNCCRYVSIVTALFFSSGAAIICIVGLAYAKGFLKSCSALNCAILTFYYDITNGQTTTITPKWIGIEGIYSTLTGMKTKLKTISDSVDGTFSGDGFLDTDPPKYQKSLDDLYTSYSPRTLANPNPGNVSVTKNPVIPSYIKLYGKSTTTNTAQYAIAQEYDATITGSKTVVRQIKQFSQAIKSNINDIQSQLDNIANQIKSLNSTIDSFSQSVISNLITAQGQMKTNGLTIFYIFFSLILGLNVINIIGIIMFGCCKSGFFKWFSHLSWFLNSIFLIITFILGSAFCIFAVFGEDSSKSFLYLFSNSSLARGDLFGNSANSKIISICINQDGDLANRYFNLSSTGVDSVAQLYNASLALNKTRDTVALYNNSIAISTLKQQYTNITNDIRLVAFPDSDASTQITTIFEAWFGWTDAGRNGKMASCPTPALDLFYQNQADCPAGYTVTGNTAPKANLQAKSCLIVKSWDANSVNARYNTYTCGGNSDFTNANVANNNYWLKISTFIDQNSALLASIIKDHDSILNVQFTSTITKLLDLIGKVQALVAPLVDMLQSLVGKNSFYNMINCKFMGIDLQNFLNIFGGSFSTTSKGLGIMIIIISFFNAVAIIFTIFMINFTIDPPVVQQPPQNMEMGKV